MVTQNMNSRLVNSDKCKLIENMSLFFRCTKLSRGWTELRNKAFSEMQANSGIHVLRLINNDNKLYSTENILRAFPNTNGIISTKEHI